MIIRIHDAIRDALCRIQELGYVILSARDGQHIEIVWLGDGDPPEIDQLVDIIQADQVVLERVLEERTVSVPAWLFMGYPWEHPQDYWKQFQKVSGFGVNLEAKKGAYAKACLQFYKNKKDVSWKKISWSEPWPIAS